MLLHKFSIINGSVTQGSFSEEASHTSLLQKPNLKKKKKKNAGTVLCCLSMWKCNMRRGLNHQRTQIKGKMTGTALAKPPIYRLPIIWATLTHNSGKYLREQVGKAERRHWKRDKRDTILN